MILLFDVGNSNIMFGISDGKEILRTYRLHTDLTKTEDQYFIEIESLVGKHQNISSIIIASVVPQITTILEKVSSKFYKVKPITLGVGVKTGVQVVTDNPKEVGADLICAAAAVVEEKVPQLIIDLGTATKYIYVTDRKITGVIISPGVEISIKALVGNTALLPNIDIKVPKKVLGTNTLECMQSGVTYGIAAQLDGLIERVKDEVNEDFEVVLTGGLAGMIAPLIKSDNSLRPNLILEGLLTIYHKNVCVFK